MLLQKITRFLRDEDGAVAIEYSLLAALIAVGIIVGAQAVGTDINDLFNRIATCLSSGACDNIFPGG